MVEPTVILAGAIPAAILALTLDGGLTLIERAVRRTMASGRQRRTRLGDRRRAGAAPRGHGWRPSLMMRGSTRRHPDRIEELHRTDHSRRDSRPHHRVSDRAARSNAGSIWVGRSSATAPSGRGRSTPTSSTGTAATAIFHDPPDTDARRVLDQVRRRYADAGVTASTRSASRTPSRSSSAARMRPRLGLRTIADAARQSRPMDRGLRLRIPAAGRRISGAGEDLRADVRVTAARDGPVAHLPRARERQVDPIAGDATSGLIEADGLAMLEDNQHYFPPYDAIPVCTQRRAPRAPRAQGRPDGAVGPDYRSGHAPHEPERRRGPSGCLGRGAGVRGQDCVALGAGA